jgi:hypothetical protein
MRSSLTGQWYVVTRWTEKDGAVTASEKHAVYPPDAELLEQSFQQTPG